MTNASDVVEAMCRAYSNAVNAADSETAQSRPAPVKWSTA